MCVKLLFVCNVSRVPTPCQFYQINTFQPTTRSTSPCNFWAEIYRLCPRLAQIRPEKCTTTRRIISTQRKLTPSATARSPLQQSFNSPCVAGDCGLSTPERSAHCHLSLSVSPFQFYQFISHFSVQIYLQFN